MKRRLAAEDPGEDPGETSADGWPGVQVLEERTVLGRRISSTVLAIAGGAALSHAQLLPAASAAYDVVWGALMPLAAALLLLQSPISLGDAISSTVDPDEALDGSGSSRGSHAPGSSALAQMQATSSTPTPPLRQCLAAFGVATTGSVAGTLVAWSMTAQWLPGPAGAAVAAALCASYVGGSLNFAAVIQVRHVILGGAAALSSTTSDHPYLELRVCVQATGEQASPMAATALAADNAAMAVYFVGLSLVASSSDAEQQVCATRVVGQGDKVAATTASAHALPSSNAEACKAEAFIPVALTSSAGASGLNATALDSTAGSRTAHVADGTLLTRGTRPTSAAPLAGSVAIAAACCLAGNQLALALQQPALRMACMAAVATLVGSLFLPRLPRALQSALDAPPGAHAPQRLRNTQSPGPGACVAPIRFNPAPYRRTATSGLSHGALLRHHWSGFGRRRPCSRAATACAHCCAARVPRRRRGHRGAGPAHPHGRSVHREQRGRGRARHRGGHGLRARVAAPAAGRSVAWFDWIRRRYGNWAGSVAGAVVVHGRQGEMRTCLHCSFAPLARLWSQHHMRALRARLFLRACLCHRLWWRRGGPGMAGCECGVCLL